MQYDIAAKILLELSKKEVLQNLLGVDVKSAELIEELPQETVRAKRDDFPIRVKQNSGEEIVIVLELQTNWVNEKCLDLIDYYIDFKRKYKLPVEPFMILFNQNSSATDIYKDKYIHFKFNLVKIWEIKASKFLDEKFIKLWPFIPLMENGIKYVEKIENDIYQSDLERKEKVDLLTILSIFTGLRDKSLCSELIKKRRDIMIESPAYELIEKEGERKKALETAKKLLEDNVSIENICKYTGLTKEELEKENIV